MRVDRKTNETPFDSHEYSQKVLSAQMEALKGIARRATQTVRDGLSTNQISEEDRVLAETTTKIHHYERVGSSINEKLIRVSRLYTELGNLMKSISEDYRGIPEKSPENEAVINGMTEASNQLLIKGLEFQATLKEYAQNPISMFLKEVPKLRELEEDRASKKLEYEFFRSKVLELRKDPPKDTSRIPRNEQILENWRVELWKSTEANKAAASSLYIQGRQVVDRSVLVMIQTSGNFVHSTVGCLKQHLFNASLPEYPTIPVLPPAPLPPNPMPPLLTSQQPLYWQGQPPQAQYLVASSVYPPTYPALAPGMPPGHHPPQ